MQTMANMLNEEQLFRSVPMTSRDQVKWWYKEVAANVGYQVSNNTNNFTPSNEHDRVYLYPELADDKVRVYPTAPRATNQAQFTEIDIEIFPSVMVIPKRLWEQKPENAENFNLPKVTGPYAKVFANARAKGMLLPLIILVLRGAQSIHLLQSHEQSLAIRLFMLISDKAPEVVNQLFPPITKFHFPTRGGQIRNDVIFRREDAKTGLKLSKYGASNQNWSVARSTAESNLRELERPFHLDGLPGTTRFFVQNLVRLMKRDIGHSDIRREDWDYRSSNLCFGIPVTPSHDVVREDLNRVPNNTNLSNTLGRQFVPNRLYQFRRSSQLDWVPHSMNSRHSASYPCYGDIDSFIAKSHNEFHMTLYQTYSIGSGPNMGIETDGFYSYTDQDILTGAIVAHGSSVTIGGHYFSFGASNKPAKLYINPLAYVRLIDEAYISKGIRNRRERETWQTARYRYQLEFAYKRFGWLDQYLELNNKFFKKEDGYDFLLPPVSDQYDRGFTTAQASKIGRMFNLYYSGAGQFLHEPDVNSAGKFDDQVNFITRCRGFNARELYITTERFQALTEFAFAYTMNPNKPVNDRHRVRFDVGTGTLQRRGLYPRSNIPNADHSVMTYAIKTHLKDGLGNSIYQLTRAIPNLLNPGGNTYADGTIRNNDQGYRLGQPMLSACVNVKQVKPEQNENYKETIVLANNRIRFTTNFMTKSSGSEGGLELRDDFSLVMKKETTIRDSKRYTEDITFTPRHLSSPYFDNQQAKILPTGRVALLERPVLNTNDKATNWSQRDRHYPISSYSTNTIYNFNGDFLFDFQDRVSPYIKDSVNYPTNVVPNNLGGIIDGLFSNRLHFRESLNTFYMDWIGCNMEIWGNLLRYNDESISSKQFDTGTLPWDHEHVNEKEWKKTKSDHPRRLFVKRTNAFDNRLMSYSPSLYRYTAVNQLGSENKTDNVYVKFDIRMRRDYDSDNLLAMMGLPSTLRAGNFDKLGKLGDIVRFFPHAGSRNINGWDTQQSYYWNPIKKLIPKGDNPEPLWIVFPIEGNDVTNYTHAEFQRNKNHTGKNTYNLRNETTLDPITNTRYIEYGPYFLLETNAHAERICFLAVRVSAQVANESNLDGIPLPNGKRYYLDLPTLSVYRTGPGISQMVFKAEPDGLVSERSDYVVSKVLPEGNPTRGVYESFFKHLWRANFSSPLGSLWEYEPKLNAQGKITGLDYSKPNFKTPMVYKSGTEGKPDNFIQQFVPPQLLESYHHAPWERTEGRNINYHNVYQMSSNPKGFVPEHYVFLDNPSTYVREQIKWEKHRRIPTVIQGKTMGLSLSHFPDIGGRGSGSEFRRVYLDDLSAVPNIIAMKSLGGKIRARWFDRDSYSYEIVGTGNVKVWFFRLNQAAQIVEAELKPGFKWLSSMHFPLAFTTTENNYCGFVFNNNGKFENIVMKGFSSISGNRDFAHVPDWTKASWRRNGLSRTYICPEDNLFETDAETSMPVTGDPQDPYLGFNWINRPYVERISQGKLYRLDDQISFKNGEFLTEKGMFNFNEPLKNKHLSYLIAPPGIPFVKYPFTTAINSLVNTISQNWIYALNNILAYKQVGNLQDLYPPDRFINLPTGKYLKGMLGRSEWNHAPAVDGFGVDQVNCGINPDSTYTAIINLAGAYSRTYYYFDVDNFNIYVEEMMNNGHFFFNLFNIQGTDAEFFIVIAKPINIYLNRTNRQADISLAKITGLNNKVHLIFAEKGSLTIHFTGNTGERTQFQYASIVSSQPQNTEVHLDNPSRVTLDIKNTNKRITHVLYHGAVKNKT